jgi:hypothetical protein
MTVLSRVSLKRAFSLKSRGRRVVSPGMLVGLTPEFWDSPFSLPTLTFSGGSSVHRIPC